MTNGLAEINGGVGLSTFKLLFFISFMFPVFFFLLSLHSDNGLDPLTHTHVGLFLSRQLLTPAATSFELVGCWQGRCEKDKSCPIRYADSRADTHTQPEVVVWLDPA